MGETKNVKHTEEKKHPDYLTTNIYHLVIDYQTTDVNNVQVTFDHIEWSSNIFRFKLSFVESFKTLQIPEAVGQTSVHQRALFTSTGEGFIIFTV